MFTGFRAESAPRYSASDCFENSECVLADSGTFHLLRWVRDYLIRSDANEYSELITALTEYFSQLWKDACEQGIQLWYVTLPDIDFRVWFSAWGLNLKSLKITDKSYDNMHFAKLLMYVKISE